MVLHRHHLHFKGKMITLYVYCAMKNFLQRRRCKNIFGVMQMVKDLFQYVLWINL